MNRPKFIVGVLLSIIIAFYLFQVYLQAELGVLAFEYSDLKEQIGIIKQKNTILHEKVLKEKSLTNINKKAVEMGFIPANYYYFTRTQNRLNRAYDTKSEIKNKSDLKQLNFLKRSVFFLVVFGVGVLLYRRSVRR